MSLSRKIAKLMVEKDIQLKDVTKTLETYNLLSLFSSILKAVKQVQITTTAQDTILIESPFALSESALTRVKRIVGNDIAPTNVSINKELLSGFRARFRGKLYDGSAERIINQLTNS